MLTRMVFVIGLFPPLPRKKVVVMRRFYLVKYAYIANEFDGLK